MGTTLADGEAASLAVRGEVTLLGGDASTPTTGNPSMFGASPDLRHALANTSSDTRMHQASGAEPIGTNLNASENMYFAPMPHRKRWIGDRAAFRDIS